MDHRIECLRRVSDFVGQGMIVADQDGNILVENDVARSLALSETPKTGKNISSKGVGLRRLLREFEPTDEGRRLERLIPLFDLKSGRHKHYRVRLGLLDCGEGEPLKVLFATAEPERVHFGEMDALMLSRIRHEIRTPLTTLRGFAELMLNRLYSEAKRKQFLRIIVEETDRLVDYLDETFSLNPSSEASDLGLTSSQEAKCERS